MYHFTCLLLLFLWGLCNFVKIKVAPFQFSNLKIATKNGTIFSRK